MQHDKSLFKLSTERDRWHTHASAGLYVHQQNALDTDVQFHYPLDRSYCLQFTPSLILRSK